MELADTGWSLKIKQKKKKKKNTNKKKAVKNNKPTSLL